MYTKVAVEYFNMPGVKGDSAKGLSETLIRDMLKRKGYVVFRADFLEYYFTDGEVHLEYGWHSNAKKTEEHSHMLNILKQVLDEERFFELGKICTYGRGIPDFLAFNKKSNDCFFVEVKLDDEPLSPAQINIIKEVLQKVEIPVLIYRVCRKKISQPKCYDLSYMTSSDTELIHDEEKWSAEQKKRHEGREKHKDFLKFAGKLGVKFK